MNKRMAAEWARMDHACECLPAGLSAMVAYGFCVRDGCVLLTALADTASNTSADAFPDRTGYEMFINSVHVDDYVQGDYLAHAWLFADALLSAWRRDNPALIAAVIVSGDDEGAVVKFHLSRIGETWLATDLDGYDEAILVANTDVAPELAGRCLI